MPKSEYKTKQRTLLMDFFQNNKNKQFSINEVTDGFIGKIGKSTVYREIARLCDEDFLKKYPGADGTVMYQFSGSHCNEHFHLRCTECGDIVHLDCHMMNDLCRHISDGHGFEIDMTRTILYGKCSRCRGINS